MTAKEAIEVLKGLVKGYYDKEIPKQTERSDPLREYQEQKDAILLLISLTESYLTALSNAKMPEKSILNKNELDHYVLCPVTDVALFNGIYKTGFNSCHDLVSPLVASLTLRIGELETECQRIEDERVAAVDSYARLEKEVVELKSGRAYRELQETIAKMAVDLASLRQRCGVEEIFKIIRYTCASDKCDDTCPGFAGECGVRKEAAAIVNHITAGKEK
jgi:hypothetical protein